MSQSGQVEEKQRLLSATIYEIIAVEGREELARPRSSLIWSGFAAGICISFSMLAEAYMTMYLPDNKSSFLIENFGYCVGFLIVIIGRMQLFTENTITVILPLLERKKLTTLIRTLKLWATVFTTNMMGTFLVAFLLVYGGLASAEQLEAIRQLSLHAVEGDAMNIFIRGIPAGFLIAALVWMMPSASSKTVIIALMTYLIAIGDFTHVVAGSAEAFLVMITGDISPLKAITYIACAGAGNIIGGSGLFAVLAYAQVKDEI